MKYLLIRVFYDAGAGCRREGTPVHAVKDTYYTFYSSTSILIRCIKSLELFCVCADALPVILLMWFCPDTEVQGKMVVLVAQY